MPSALKVNLSISARIFLSSVNVSKSSSLSKVEYEVKKKSKKANRRIRPNSKYMLAFPATRKAKITS